MPYREELAWAGGLFAGEGCFTRINVYPSGIRAQLDMTEEDVIQRFQAAVGIGKVYGPYSRKNPKGKASWVWYAGGFEKLQATLAMLWPWLNERRRNRAIALLRGQ